MCVSFSSTKSVSTCVCKRSVKSVIDVYLKHVFKCWSITDKSDERLNKMGGIYDSAQSSTDLVPKSVLYDNSTRNNNHLGAMIRWFQQQSNPSVDQAIEPKCEWAQGRIIIWVNQYNKAKLLCFSPLELLTDRQTVEASALVSGSRCGKGRGPAVLFLPGASPSPPVHMESLTPRPGPARRLTLSSPHASPEKTAHPDLSLDATGTRTRCSQRDAPQRGRGKLPSFVALVRNTRLSFDHRGLFYTFW